MARVKIDYGIDLGTTNSAIARMENGEVKIIKSDTQEDTMPSCVQFRKSSVRVGRTAYNGISDEHLSAFIDFSKTGNTNHKFNTFTEFKRTMGTDKAYLSDGAGRSFSSEELSAEVLKELKSLVRDEEVSSVVITHPAQFRNNQIVATKRAAELAGFEYCELLAEPIAASIVYGVSTRIANGYYLVFDFGGGTFDAALMQVEEGITKVVDTDGNNLLGGKNVDYAIVDSVIIPYLQEQYNVEELLSSEYGKRELREALKFKGAEVAKIYISRPPRPSADIEIAPLGKDDDGNEMEIVDLNMNLQMFERAAGPIFQRAIDIAKALVKKNNLETSELEMVLLVGGPTLSQTMRKMLKEQFDTRIDTSIDPMTCVAEGAAMFASSKDIPSSIRGVDKTKVQLILKKPDTSVETEVHLGIKIDRAQTDVALPERLFAVVSSKDKNLWASDRVAMVGDGGEVILVPLRTGKLNPFEVAIFDEKGNRFPCQPADFSIRQGAIPPGATLSYSLAVQLQDTGSGKRRLHVPEGLEKNRTLPAKGKATYKTQKAIRPGIAEDIIRVPIYQGDTKTEADNNHLVGYVIVTGENLPKFLPEGSEVTITLSQNTSGIITASAFFPDLDETKTFEFQSSKEGEYDADDLDNEIKEAIRRLTILENESATVDLDETGPLRSELDELNELLAGGRSDYETKLSVKNRLRDVLKELDRIEGASEWRRAEEALDEAIAALASTVKKYGNEEEMQNEDQIPERAKTIVDVRDVEQAKGLTRDVKAKEFAINYQQLGFLLSLIKYYDANFNDCNWTNRSSARKKIDEAKVIIAGNPTVLGLQAKIREIWEYLPDHPAPPVIITDKELLIKYW